MNVVVAVVSPEGKVIFELEAEERVHLLLPQGKEEHMLHVVVRPKHEINDMHELSYALFQSILCEVEQESVKKFGNHFKLSKFVFYGFSRC
jgi:hypothetical protein